MRVFIRRQIAGKPDHQRPESGNLVLLPSGHLSSESGFSLIELMVSLIIVSTMVISVSVLINTASHRNGESASQSSANRQLQKQIDALRAASYATLTNGTYNFTTSNIPRVQSAQYILSDYSDTNGTHPELKVVQAYIKWNEGNVLKNVTLNTYIAQHGINQQ